MSNHFADQIAAHKQKPMNPEFAKAFGVMQPFEDAPKAQARPRHTPGVMNKTEQEYAAQLDVRKLANDIRWWGFECLKLKLADKCHFTPDFMVVLSSGEIEFVDTKGHVEDDAAVKIKTAAVMFPMFHFVMERKVKGKWHRRVFNP